MKNKEIKSSRNQNNTLHLEDFVSTLTALKASISARSIKVPKRNKKDQKRFKCLISLKSIYSF